MAVENDFLVFAGQSGANVVPQSSYAGQTWQQGGFVAGIAPSAQLNKPWRQSSIMAAVLAQFIVNNSGQPAIDDGTTATLLANLQAAMSAIHGFATFTSSGTFTATYTGTHFVSGAAGGGSGGGGGSNNITNAAGACGSGGGAGMPVLLQAFNLVQGVVYTVTIGAGGVSVAGAAQGVATAPNGNPGGNVVFSGSGITTLTLTGGSGGLGGGQGINTGNVSGPIGGTGFPAGGPAPDGLNAGSVQAYAAVGGGGASGPFGGGGFGGRAGQGGGIAATPGYGYGAGGAGGGSAYGIGGAGAASSAGMPGFLTIEW
ncbi:phage tail protein [Caballeronia sp. KNU42]